MPSQGSRKRRSPPTESPAPKRIKSAVKSKTSVFDAVDSPKPTSSTAGDAEAYFEQLGDDDDSSEDEDSDYDVFEDVPGLDRSGDQTPAAKSKHESEEEDEDMDWEDAIGDSSRQSPSAVDIADVSISITQDNVAPTATDRAASTLRKGPSRRERDVRNGTHCIHVQALMWHNTVRNAWLNDPELHKILLDGLPEGIRIEIDRYSKDMGYTTEPMSKTKKKTPKKGKSPNKRSLRHWEANAERTEVGAVNTSAGDPTLRLLKVLTAYWRKRFTVTAPGLRKMGYMPIKRLTQEIKSWKENRQNFERHGERVEDRAALRALAKSCEGSRDIGSQLFTALLRALGLKARMVANLQPAGIGWGKVEEAKTLKEQSAAAVAKPVTNGAGKSETPVKKTAKDAKAMDKRKTPNGKTEERPQRSSNRQSAQKVISLDSDDESSLSSAPSDLEDDDASVIDLTEVIEKRPRKQYDRDMAWPNYWTEVLSPLSNTYIPVDPIILSTVATNPELLATFEPRGKRADQAKQVLCYTIAHSSDGTAKDVTVRYLKKHQLPGRTKGYRLPVEKVKVYNKRGKVTKYEDYDWFKIVLSPFFLPDRQRTAADDLEDSTDLKAIKPDTGKSNAEVETLQWYKQSADFVLERHLRREEAILPSALPARTFTVPGKKGESSGTEEPVYRRSDVVTCKTAESWHKEGREIKFGEQPMKLVPMRAVTTMRKREIEEVERTTGEKAKQGLFSRGQTEWIIPPPIGEDREIPRNAFGNIDVYVPSMVPRGAVHLKLKGAARICRDLKISHAEAVVGFEFGKRMAIPVIQGVVVAREERERVVELWREREAERKRKEEKKRQERCLGLWRRFVMGARIVERMRKEYAVTGEEGGSSNPFVRKEDGKKRREIEVVVVDSDVEQKEEEEEEEEELQPGGFLIEDHAGEKEDLSSASIEPVRTKAAPVSLRAARAAVISETVDDNGSLSSLSSPSELESEPSAKPTPPAKKGKTVPAKRLNGTSTRGRGRGKGKARPSRVSPTKSRYFAAATDEDEDMKSEDDEESSVDGDEEIVTPRRTTARTRGRGKGR